MSFIGFPKPFEHPQRLIVTIALLLLYGMMFDVRAQYKLRTQDFLYVLAIVALVFVLLGPVRACLGGRVITG